MGMEAAGLVIEIVPAAALPAGVRDEIAGLTSRCFHTDYRVFLDSFHQPVHLLGRLRGALVSHALWVERWLQVDDGPLLRTAFVEAVVTDEGYRGRGFAAALMKRLVAALDGYQLAALGPGVPQLYAKLGWERWQGPLAVRTEGGIELSPADEVTMIYRLPDSPPLDVSRQLSVEWRPGDIW